jgi:hypothetical protein
MTAEKFFEISKDIIAIDLFLYLKKHNTFIISDMHIGYEESLNSKGILIPKRNYDDLVLRIEKSLNYVIKNYNLKKIDNIVLNGDLLHDFNKVPFKVKQKLSEFIELLSSYSNLIIIEGNHDKVLKFILKRNTIYKKIIFEDILIIHGDKIIDDFENYSKIKTIIMGHEHPAVSISSGYRSEIFRCFLKGKYDSKNIIITPSCNLSNEGSDVLSGKLLSPYLKKNSDFLNFQAFVIGEEIFDFGKLKKLKKL